MAAMGIVVKFDAERGFGFVRLPGSEDDALADGSGAGPIRLSGSPRP